MQITFSQLSDVDVKHIFIDNPIAYLSQSIMALLP